MKRHRSTAAGTAAGRGGPSCTPLLDYVAFAHERPTVSMNRPRYVSIPSSLAAAVAPTCVVGRLAEHQVQVPGKLVHQVPIALLPQQRLAFIGEPRAGALRQGSGGLIRGGSGRGALGGRPGQGQGCWRAPAVLIGGQDPAPIFLLASPPHRSAGRQCSGPPPGCCPPRWSR